jgi:GST-like protein
MLEVYTGPTPNGQKIAIMLAETGLPYELHEIDILAGDQLTDAFRAISPNNKHPAVVDPEGPDGRPVTVWESGAILIYLAEKTGMLIPEDPLRRIEMLKWLFFQAANQGPMAGQLAHFAFYAKERIAYAIDRYRNEVTRQYAVLDAHLAEHEYVADEYSIADISLLPYAKAASARFEFERPNVTRWIDTLMAREAVGRGMDFMTGRIRRETIAGGMDGFNDEHRSILFGERQYERSRTS